MAIPLIPLIAAGVAAGAGSAGAAAGGASGANTFRGSNFTDTEDYDPGRFEYGKGNYHTQAEKDRIGRMRADVDLRQGAQLDANAYNMTQDAARGNAPSQAQNLLRGAQDETLGQNMGMAGAVKGGAGARIAAMRQAQTANSLQQARNANQMSALSAQEQATARGQLGQMATTNAALQMQQRAMNDQRAMGYEGMRQTVDQNQLQANMNQQQLAAQSHQSADSINAGINQKNADNTKDMWKSVVGAVAGGGGGAASAAGGAAGMGSDLDTKVPMATGRGPMSNMMGPLGGLLSDDSTKLAAAYQKGLRDAGEAPYLGDVQDDGEIRDTKIRQPTSFSSTQFPKTIARADEMMARDRANLARGPAVGKAEPDTEWLDSEMRSRGEDRGVPAAPRSEEDDYRDELAMRQARADAAGPSPSPDVEYRPSRGAGGGGPMPYGLIPGLMYAYERSQERDGTTSDEEAKAAAYAEGQANMLRQVREYSAGDPKKLREDSSTSPAAAVVRATKFRTYGDAQKDKGEAEARAREEGAEAQRVATLKRSGKLLIGQGLGAAPQVAAAYDEAPPEQKEKLAGAGKKAQRVAKEMWLANPAASALSSLSDESTKDKPKESTASKAAGIVSPALSMFVRKVTGGDTPEKKKADPYAPGAGKTALRTDMSKDAAYIAAKKEREQDAKLADADEWHRSMDIRKQEAFGGKRRPLRDSSVSDGTAKTGKLPPVGDDEMSDALRSMQGASYAYKDEYRPSHQKPGEVNVGPVANAMAEDDVASTAIFRDKGTGKLAIDKEKALKLSLSGLSSLQNQLDDLKRSMKGRKGKRRG